jgi:membrane protein DedA with SNARE-associated domain
MGTTVGTGLLGIRLRDFVIGAAISALIWTALPLSIGYAFRSNVSTIEGYYQSILDALPVTLGIASLIVVASVLGRSAATRARLREVVAPVWSRVHPSTGSMPEISQEPPPALH